MTRAAVAVATILALPMLAAARFQADPYKVDVQNGNFTVKSVSFVPGHSWQKWQFGTTAIVTVKGTAHKKILAGTVKWQVYQTGVRSFLDQGDKPYFLCNNKGCDTHAAVALQWVGSTMSDFVLTFTYSMPKADASSSSRDFKLVFWGEDQDHSPYDFSATVSYSYAAAQDAQGATPELDVEALVAAAVKAQEAPLVVHHADHDIGAGGDAHCSYMKIEDPTSNEYWTAHGYQYPAALWPRGPCPAKYNYFNRKRTIAPGVEMVTLGIHSKPKLRLRGVGATQVEAEAEAEDVDTSFLYQLTNPGSPQGKQHCLELDNPGGSTSKYWANKGWKYTMPPWKVGKCDRTRFNYVNRVTRNLDGFEGVVFWELGIQV